MKRIFINDFKISSLIFCLTSFLITVCIVSPGCKESEDNNPPTQDIPFTDNFDESSLNSNWKWTNGADLWNLGTTKQGWLTIYGNTDANIFCDDNASFLYQVLNENKDFDISTKLYCEWGNNSSDVAGIIIKFPSEDDWILIKLWMHGDGTGRLEFQKKCSDIISPVPGSESSGGKTEVYLRFQKSGTNYTAYFKNSGDTEWTTIGSQQFPDNYPMYLGLFAGIDKGDGELLVQFDYFQK